MKALLTAVIALTLSTAVFAKRPENPGSQGKGRAQAQERVMICHYGEETVIVDGVETTVIETAILNIPEKASLRHIQNHGDVPLQTGDAEADAQALADCQEFLASDDDDEEEVEDDTDTEEPEVITIEEANEAEFVNTRTGAE